MASEREQWLAEERRAQEQRRDELLLTAHKQWSLAQEPLHHREVEKARKEGAELARKEGVGLATNEHKVCRYSHTMKPYMSDIESWLFSCALNVTVAMSLLKTWQMS